MRFIWDEDKREKNIKKHGLDFADAKIVFKDPCAWFSLDNRYSEERWLLIGKLRSNVAVIAYSEPDEITIRIISMRPAVRKETRQYEKQKEATYERS